MIVWSRHVQVSDTGIKVSGHRREIKWDEIVGIREYASVWLSRLAPPFPLARLYLRDGAAVTLTSTLRVTWRAGGRSETYGANRGANYGLLMHEIRAKALNTDPVKSRWWEWRIAAGAAVVFLPVWTWMAVSILQSGFRVEPNGGSLSAAAYAGLLLGWVWERRARALFMGE